MKAGRKLDAKLCALLEERPPHDPRIDVFNTPGVSPAGFWKRVIFPAQGYQWQPIPVSTDWAATEKMMAELQRRGYTTSIRRPAFDPWKVWIVELACEWNKDKWGWKGGCIHADALPHALALAATEALGHKAAK